MREIQQRFRLGAGLCAVAGVFLITSTLGHAQTQADQKGAESVVKITCNLDRGQANATGFVWSKPTYVVTALHAAVGCRRINVWSEKTKKQATARIVRAHLESDLALLELSRDLQLAPLAHAPSAPKLDEDFYVWGYPRAIPSMLGKKISFARGLKKEATLGSSFFKSPDELEKLLKGQQYPQWGTKILRVGSTIQPGHSGAPILDRQGQVVAVADGGLFNGTAGINWSIPAAAYLPGLAGSKDPVPSAPSRQALLFSSFAAKEEKTVAFEFENGADQPTDADADGALRLVRTIPITDLADLMVEDDLDYYREILQWIAEEAQEAGVDIARISIDVYEDYEAGATVSVPSGFLLDWNDEKRLIETFNEEDTVGMVVSIGRTGSWHAARARARDFIGELQALADWEKDDETSEVDEQEQLAWLGVSFTEKDEEDQILAQANLSISIDRGDTLGSAVYHLDPFEELSAKEAIDFYLLLLSEQLTDFSKR